MVFWGKRKNPKQRKISDGWKNRRYCHNVTNRASLHVEYTPFLSIPIPMPIVLPTRYTELRAPSSVGFEFSAIPYLETDINDMPSPRAYNNNQQQNIMPYSDDFEEDYGENAFPHSVLPRRPRKEPVYCKRWFLLSAGFGLFVVALIGIVAGTVSSSKSSSSPKLSGGVPPGAVPPSSQVEQDVLTRNKNELGTLLISLYNKHNLDWKPLQQDNTPQGLALTHVAGHKDYNLADETNVQLFVLSTFYYSTYSRPHQFFEEMKPWTSAKNWIKSKNVCEWEGVICRDGVVVAISLPEHDLVGTLPVELAFLDNLQGLELYSNYLFQADHTLFSVLPNMIDLDLEDNYIYTNSGIPTEMAKMTNLQKLSMSYNLLQGPLDGTLFQGLSKLTHLEVESNYLSGSLPQTLLNLDSLLYLYIRRNAFTINLQDFIQPNNLKNIFALWIDNNDVSGSIPSAISAWSDLHSFSITNTTVTGRLPDSMGQLPLKRVWLYDNQLTGPIPNSWGSWTDLQVLELSGNPGLTGSMPAQICNTMRTSDYEFKKLEVNCDSVICPLKTCCTSCA